MRYRQITSDERYTILTLRQRGFNQSQTAENLSGLLRQYLPKWTSLAGLTPRHGDALAHRLNTRPRTRSNYRTPEQCVNAS